MFTPKLKLILFVCFSCFVTASFAQPTWTIDPFGKEKKPAQYEEKILASEKTDKKLTTFRRIIQNNVTHYNFYFNANNKLNGVIERAKLSQKEDYSQLLSFYPYSLENTASQKVELDSVIYKSTAGILLHDLRTDWVDNMYLLIGKAYYFRKQFDSAALTFQFINYNLFPRKRKNDDDDRIVGTNDEPGTGALSIANKEKRNIVQKVMTLPPSRNDALIWLTRTFIDQEEYGDAAGLINILQHDRNLPQRLKNDLEEVTAYWFFTQNNLDSSAVHLERALSNADTKQDKSRWEFLLAQLFEINGEYEKASDFYGKAAKHTTDPVMDIFARLNDAKMMRNTGNTKELENSIANLLKMARKDKYENYRDIIYYSTGQLSMQVPDTANAIVSYEKSTLYNQGNIPYKNRSFLQLADIAYVQKRYVDAHSYYDSLDLTDKSFASQTADITDRKESLAKIVEKITNIQREDSLQLIAAMAPAERDALIKKMVRRYRKEQGLKEEDNSGGTAPITFANSKNAEPADLFPTSTRGEWYFYNSSAKSRGFSEFKSKWGKRENVDNWQRKSAIDAALTKSLTAGTGNYDDPDKVQVTPGTTLVNNASAPVEYSYDALIANVPLSTERMDSSNKVISENMLALAKLFQEELLDYGEAIKTYNEYLQRFANSGNEAEIYLGLYYCYSKLGDASKAAYYKNVVTSKYAGSTASNKILNPSLLDPNKKNPEVTQRYADIYNMFIEGKFSEATEAKKKADSVYGTNYWSPQLLYIEAVQQIKERNDTNAIAILNDLKDLYPASPLKNKAIVLIDVLGRRAEIEGYLTDLKVTRAEEEKLIFVDETPIKTEKPVVKPVTTAPVAIAPAVKPQILRDTAALKVAPELISSGFTLELDKPQFVVMILDKVDGVYINEAKNAFSRFNRESYYTQNIVITRDAIDGEKTLLLFSPFEDVETAVKYFDKIKKAAPTEVSWLPANKYSFMIISAANLQVLKTNKDLPAYKALLNKNLGNKF